MENSTRLAKGRQNEAVLTRHHGGLQARTTGVIRDSEHIDKQEGLYESHLPTRKG